MGIRIGTSGLHHKMLDSAHQQSKYMNESIMMVIITTEKWHIPHKWVVRIKRRYTTIMLERRIFSSTQLKCK